MPSIRPGDKHTIVTVGVGPWNAKFVAEAIAEICSLAGYEFRVIPNAPEFVANVNGVVVSTPANVPKIGRVQVLSPFPATNATPFEYGTTRANVASYSFKVDRDEQANQVYVPRIGYPEPGYLGAETTQSALNSTASAAFGRLQAWVDPGEIYLAATRLDLAESHLDIRLGPRRRVTFQPARNNIMQPFVDYEVGDWVRFRAFNGDALRFDLTVRIWSMTIGLDDNGNESVTVETVEGG